MNGRSPGFSSFVLYVPDTQTLVILLGNIYSSATTTMGYDIATLSLGLPYEQVHFMHRALSEPQIKASTGTFQFGADFYQVNARVDSSRTVESWLCIGPRGRISQPRSFMTASEASHSYNEVPTAGFVPNPQSQPLPVFSMASAFTYPADTNSS
jgi:hypothetical protein